MEEGHLELSLRLGRFAASCGDGDELEEVSVEQSVTSDRGGGRGRSRTPGEQGGGVDIIGVDAGSDNENEEGAGRKKLRLNKEQAAVLEQSFKDHPTLNPKQKLALAKQLNLRPRQVEVWFQNRRARSKLKQTEVDCEYLKRCYENLTEENRRLQREVMELRALKRTPHVLMRMPPPTTLTLCPSCDRADATDMPAASFPFRHKIRL